MNIIFITAEFPYPPNSGGRIYTWQRIKYLSENNDIFLFSLIENDDLKYLENEEIKGVLKYIKTYKRKNKLIQAIKGINYPFSVATRKIGDIKKDIDKLIDKINIDLIIVDHPQMLINCNMNDDIPKILTQHNIEYRAFESMCKNSKNLIKKIIYKREYKLMKKFEEKYYNKNLISAYTFISQEDKEFFERRYCKDNTYLIPPGIDFIEPYYNKNIGTNIVFTGKMDYEPNIQSMQWFCSDILPKVKNKLPDVKLYIVGKNPTQYITSLANENIIVTGEVDSVVEYLKMANIVIIPLLSGGGVKIKLMEALQYRNIIVTTPIGIEGTKFRHNEEVLSAESADEFAKHCVDALKNPRKYGQQIIKSLECIKENYLWSSIGGKYEKLIYQIIDKKDMH